jgi:RimJ/RimL family protein N-acetyltransferase
MLPETFRTARLVLRPIGHGDDAAIFDGYARDAEVTRFLTWRPHGCRGDTDAYIDRCLAASADVSRTYVITDRADGAVRGAFDLRRAVPFRLEVGCVLARAWWRQGLMTEALAEVADWALGQPSVFRIAAVCDVENIGSARVMEKAGLVREGVLRRWMMHPNAGDEPRDCFSYARVR